MLVLNRAVGQRIRIEVAGRTVWIQVGNVGENNVKLLFSADKDVLILREEVIGKRKPELRS